MTVRTFDVSESQLRIEHTAIEGTRSPLGMRGIRLSLAIDEIFQAQLRALLRAAAHGPLRVMFPFVSRHRRAAGGSQRRGPGAGVAARRAASATSQTSRSA